LSLEHSARELPTPTTLSCTKGKAKNQEQAETISHCDTNWIKNLPEPLPASERAATTILQNNVTLQGFLSVTLFRMQKKSPKGELAPLEIRVEEEIPPIKELLKSKFKDPARGGSEKVRSEQVVADDYWRDRGKWTKVEAGY
jgi:hypothetical protein